MPKRFVAYLAVPTFAIALVSAAPAPEVPEGLGGTWAIGGSECATDTI